MNKLFQLNYKILYEFNCNTNYALCLSPIGDKVIICNYLSLDKIPELDQTGDNVLSTEIAELVKKLDFDTAIFTFDGICINKKNYLYPNTDVYTILNLKFSTFLIFPVVDIAHLYDISTSPHIMNIIENEICISYFSKMCLSKKKLLESKQNFTIFIPLNTANFNQNININHHILTEPVTKNKSIYQTLAGDYITIKDKTVLSNQSLSNIYLSNYTCKNGSIYVIDSVLKCDIKDVNLNIVDFLDVRSKCETINKLLLSYYTNENNKINNVVAIIQKFSYKIAKVSNIYKIYENIDTDIKKLKNNVQDTSLQTTLANNIEYLDKIIKYKTDINDIIDNLVNSTLELKKIFYHIEKDINKLEKN